MLGPALYVQIDDSAAVVVGGHGHGRARGRDGGRGACLGSGYAPHRLEGAQRCSGSLAYLLNVGFGVSGPPPC